MELIIPAAGKSSRFNLLRPKFLLTHPIDGTMLEASLAGLTENQFRDIERITVISLSSFFVDLDVSRLESRLTVRFGKPCKIFLLEEETASMVDTVEQYLRTITLDIAFAVKDCDNQFTPAENFFADDSNGIGYVDLVKNHRVTPHNKSFIKLGQANSLLDIVEKQIISPYINVGLVRFRSSADFLEAASSLPRNREIYISDIVRILTEWGQVFEAQECSHYEDWGTLVEWNAYCSKFATLFVDLDGVVFQNENPLGIKGGWTNTNPIIENLDYLLQLQDLGSVTFVFTTSRSHEYRGLLEDRLRQFGFLDFSLVTNLPHAKRILINDFAPSNRYPTSIGINIPRNSNQLEEYLGDVLK